MSVRPSPSASDVSNLHLMLSGGGIRVFGHISSCIKTPVFNNANTVGHDQPPRSAASDLGLHCLKMSVLLSKELQRQITSTTSDNVHNVRKRIFGHVHLGKS